MIPLIPALLAALIVYIATRKETKNEPDSDSSNSSHRDSGSEPSPRPAKPVRRSGVDPPKKDEPDEFPANRSKLRENIAGGAGDAVRDKPASTSEVNSQPNITQEATQNELPTDSHDSGSDGGDDVSNQHSGE